MDDRHDAGDRDREQRHRFRETVDRAAPLLPRQQQHGRDQRAGVADPDPPDVVRDRHAPHNGGVDAPDPDSLIEQPADRAEEPEHERQAGEQGEPPDLAGGLKQRLGDGLRDLDIAGSLGGNPAMRRRQALFEHRRSCSALVETRRGIADVGEIGGARARPEMFEQRIMARVGFLPVDGRVLLVEVAETDRAGRAGALAGGLDLVRSRSAGRRVRRRGAPR